MAGTCRTRRSVIYLPKLPITKPMSEKTYDEWKAELIQITAKETGRPAEEIKLNDTEARAWYDDGVPAYFTFRETYQS